MTLDEISKRMDASVEAMIHSQERDQIEAMLIKLSHSLIQKLDARDREIAWLRAEIADLKIKVVNASTD
jgi:hypothetical protein